MQFSRLFRFTEVNCFAVTTFNFIKDIVFICCSYSMFWFTKEFTQSVFSVKVLSVGGPGQAQQKSICRLMNILHYLRHFTLQKFGNDLLMAFIPFLNVRIWKTFFITLTIFIKILSFLWSNGELAILDTLFK